MPSNNTDPFTRAAQAVLIIGTLPAMATLLATLAPSPEIPIDPARPAIVVALMLALACGLWRRSAIALWIALASCLLIAASSAVTLVTELTGPWKGWMSLIDLVLGGVITAMALTGARRLGRMRAAVVVRT